MSSPPTSTNRTRRTTLSVRGMRCASCVGRIEKEFATLPGVSAHVNLATEQATVIHESTVQPTELVKAVSRAGYKAHIHKETRPQPAFAHGANDLLPRLIAALTLSAPIAALSMVPLFRFPGWEIVTAVLAAVVVFYSGWQFHVNAVRSAKHVTATMDTLISLGTLTAYFWSLWAMVVSTSHLYFETAALVTSFVLLGRFIEVRTKRRAGAAIHALASLGAPHARVLRRDGLRKDNEEVIPISDLHIGDEFVVRPGETLATDGIVVRGHSAINASMLTGESIPTEVGPGSNVVGGTLNTNGRLVVRATRVGADTQLAVITRLAEEAHTRKAAIARLADRIAAIFVPFVILLALATGTFWLIMGAGGAAAVSTAVAVLIIACPCALGLATPVALLAGTSRGAQLGILIRGPEVLESTRRIDTIVLDKTGTITTGQMSLVSVVLADRSVSEDRRREILARIGAVEAASSHPIAQAVTAGISREVGTLPEPHDFREEAGVGVSATVNGTHVQLRRAGGELPPALKEAVESASRGGHTAVVAVLDDKPTAVLTVADTLKPQVADAVSALRHMGLTPVLLTGDNSKTAHTVADAAGIRHVISEVLPHEKVAAVRQLQEDGKVVAMVGDGVNDAAALAAADLGIAMGTGTNAAIEASDLTLVSGDINAIPQAIRLARRTLTTIKQNLFWAFAYNIAALPLAAAGLLSPLIAGGAMAFSSVFVVVNSVRASKG